MREIITRNFGFIEERYFMFEGHRINIMEGMVHLAGVAMAINTDNAGIYVDEYFMELSEETQNFVLYHELGHEYYNHKGGLVYNIKREIASQFGWVIKEERLADKYAYDKVGKEASLKAINEIKDKFKEILKDLDVKKDDKWMREFKSRCFLLKIAK